MVGQKENRPCVPYFFVYSGADFDGDGLTSHNFRYSMLKAKDFLDGETAWEAFPDHILSHIPPRKAWKQRRQERRRASFSERKGAKIARKGRKNIPTAIWEHQAASSSLATPTIAAAVFDLPRHFFCLPLPTLSLHTQKPSGRNARHPLGFLCFLLLFLLAFPFCAFWGFFVYFFRRVYKYTKAILAHNLFHFKGFHKKLKKYTIKIFGFCRLLDLKEKRSRFSPRAAGMGRRNSRHFFRRNRRQAFARFLVGFPSVFHRLSARFFIGFPPGLSFDWPPGGFAGFRPISSRFPADFLPGLLPKRRRNFRGNAA